VCIHFSGIVLEEEVIDDTNMTENATSGVEGFSQPLDFISLHVTGPILLYFYSDLAKYNQGFYIEYW